MSKVITALQEGSNALLESPTGTGKTLCLLCSTLAWRESLKGSASSLSTYSQHPESTTLLQASAPSIPTRRPVTVGGGPVLLGGNSVPEELQSMLQAERQMTNTANAGGTGGSAAATSNSSGSLPVIIYSSRTHSQLAQVIKELRNTSYSDRVKSTVLASRQQSCLHPKISKLSGGQANNGCKSLVSHKKCSWYNNLKYNRGKEWTTQVSGIPDIEDLVAVGKAHNVCPFYMSKDMSKEADIIFMPYNYLLDPNTRKALVDQVKWENAVIVFDEAHNVESVCSDASSFDITSKNLADAMQELKRCKEACLEQLERGTSLAMDAGGAAGAVMPVNYRQLASDLDLFQKVLKLMENALHALAEKLPLDGLTRPGAFMFQFLQGVKITEMTMPTLNSTIDMATEVLQAFDMEEGQTGASSKAHIAALQHLQSCLNLAFSTMDPVSGKPNAPPAHKGYRFHVRMEKSWGQDKLPTPTLSFWCFIPGMAFRMLRHLGLKSIILTSGTLAPLESFAHELQLPFPIRLQNPHIIKPSQVWVGVVPLGPSGHVLNSSYQSRDDVGYKDDLGNCIVNFARTVPDGLLVFFASYVVLEKCIEHWKAKGAPGSTWERIMRYKSPVVEPRDSALFPQAIEDYKTKLEDPGSGGAVFFAVCRGKVSEGLDFSDKAGRGVIITGIPFAMKTDAKVRLKREVLDEDVRAGREGLLGGYLSGEQWYVQQAMRAVNQAMGRVIRHRWDYGAVILADKRFSDGGSLGQISAWLKDYVVQHPNFGQAAASLTRFFKDKADFQVPPEYQSKLKQQSNTTSSAFQFVGAGSSTMLSATGRVQTNNLPGRARLLTDSAPAAVDVSGLLGITVAAGAAAAAVPVSKKQMEAGRSSRTQASGAAGRGLIDMLKQEQDLRHEISSDVARSRALEAPALRTGAGPQVTDKVEVHLPTERSQASTEGARAAKKLTVNVDNALAMVKSNSEQHINPLETVLLSLGREGGNVKSHPPSVAAGAVGSAAAVVAAAGAVAGSANAPLSHRTGVSAEEHLKGTGKGPYKSSFSALLGCQNAGSGTADLQGQRSSMESADRQNGSDVGPVHRSCQEPAGQTLTEGRPLNEHDEVLLWLRNPKLGSAADHHQLQQQRQGKEQQELVVDHEPQSADTESRAGGSHPGPSTSKPLVGPGSGTNAYRPVANDKENANIASSSSKGQQQQQQQQLQRRDPQAFMAQLKSELPTTLMTSVGALLTQYRQARDTQHFIEGITQLLKGSSTVHLLQGFVAFLPKADRVWFGEVVKTHVADSRRRDLQEPGQQLKGRLKSCELANKLGDVAEDKDGRRLNMHNLKPDPLHAVASTSNRVFQTGGTARDDQRVHFKVKLPQPDPSVHLRVQPVQPDPSVHLRVQPVQPDPSVHLRVQPAQPDLSDQQQRQPAAPVIHQQQLQRQRNPVPSNQQQQQRLQKPGLTDPRSASGQQVLSLKRPSEQLVPSGNIQGSHGNARDSTAESLPRSVMPGTNHETSAAKKARHWGPAGLACTICGQAPIKEPSEGPCKHVACSICWRTQVTRAFCCAICKRSVRQGQIMIKYYK
ncbi:hypothetical protein CEUSTIGMA_g5475.t1 [Chlamydomonas eustigma]|uniref:Regulator of telomere elongation helicase 1 homolog n=1 Tax=Chlamydomonas eustigma TaxID=1157962 RepID=A0A250X4M9_9CHLO|nr:hypothetical protein CEUSTIGMA_g5475.t1 [Chlamydomonas eustigma]|eukprot:GAX78033.1 hypothetical protein CEUSTIGMA_g5475.t1 [Chlamydomonas eustigma]